MMMANDIARIVGQPRWGGGIHKEHLAFVMGVRPARRATWERALMIAYRQGLIDFCWPYVVPGPRSRTHSTA